MNIENIGDRSVVRLPDRFSGSAVKDFQSAVAPMVDSGVVKSLVLDLVATKYLDSYGIGCLISIGKSIQARGGVLRLTNLPAQVRQLFQETGLDDLFEIDSATGEATLNSLAFVESVDIKLDVVEEKVRDVRVLRLSGAMTHPAGSSGFKSRLLLAFADCKKILVDLEDLTFFDSLSVGTMMSMSKLGRQTGCEIRISGANIIVRDLLTTVSVDKVVPIFDTREDALRQW